MAAETRLVPCTEVRMTEPDSEQKSPEESAQEQLDAKLLEQVLKKLRERSGEEREFPEE